MSLVKMEPMRDLARLRDEMDRVFLHPFDERMRTPAVDVREENGNLVVKADLPGIKKEDVDITATEDALTIRGNTTEETEEENEGYYRRERRCGSFLRTLPLPVAVDADKAQAKFEDGAVTITLPKVERAPQGKKVAVT